MEVLHGFYDSKQFLPYHTIVSFWSGQTLAKIGDDTLLTICFLGQHSSDGIESISRINCFPASGYARIGADVSASLSLLNACYSRSSR
ncbi:hypothetical protein TNCT_687791 [Trichonephila clavata]|uniref:Uncharacterized protein n=1 Tax=Trichonephila clavata TaxID=2740835 RepID=A0A8X6FZ37_TRICU|nr:hypothetical protein TNCT_687791 [Trichonephila clavata]